MVLLNPKNPSQPPQTAWDFNAQPFRFFSKKRLECRWKITFYDGVNLKGRILPKSSALKDPKNDDLSEIKEEKAVICRKCGFHVTGIDQKTEVMGSFNHTFANPDGIVFEVGCFKDAWGTAVIGDPTDEFTWFPGYFWRIALCRRCLVHLGWEYEGTFDRFFGLILDRLINQGE